MDPEKIAPSWAESSPEVLERVVVDLHLRSGFHLPELIADMEMNLRANFFG